jgi:hypothetical protein
MDSAASATPQTSTPATPTPSERHNSSLHGVGGWLLFFIFTLVFFGPAARLFSFLLAFRQNIQTFAQAPHPHSLYTFYSVEQLVSFGIYGYGIFAGIQLWKTRPGAVEHAKRFIVALLLFAFADYVMAIIWVLLMTPEAVRTLALPEVLYGQAAKALLQTAVYAAVWYAYLLKSERVRVTFLLKCSLENTAATPD